jgi:hypothetical protein
MKVKTSIKAGRRSGTLPEDNGGVHQHNRRGR